MKRLTAGFVLFLAAATLAGGHALADGDEPAGDQFGLPAGEGRDLTVEKCSSCHSAYDFANERRTKEQWTATVNDMVSKGANVNDAEFQQIVTYLSTYLAASAQTAR